MDQDTLFAIFSVFQLPKDLRSLLNASQVCKQWKKVIYNDEFWRRLCSEHDWLFDLTDDFKILVGSKAPWYPLDRIKLSIGNTYKDRYAAFYQMNIPICLTTVGFPSKYNERNYGAGALMFVRPSQYLPRQHRNSQSNYDPKRVHLKLPPLSLVYERETRKPYFAEEWIGSGVPASQLELPSDITKQCPLCKCTQLNVIYHWEESTSHFDEWVYELTCANCERCIIFGGGYGA